MPVRLARLLVAALIAFGLQGPLQAQQAVQSGLLPAPSTDIDYTTRAGDTMIGIARRYLNDGKLPLVQRALQEHNALKDADRINPGQVIRIPENWVRNEAGRIELVSAQGDVQARGQPALAGATLVSGDELRTGANSYATVKLADGSTLVLQPGGSLAIDAVRKSPLAASPEALFTLKGGRVEADVPRRTGGGRFEIRTPVAVAAVRGTKFRVSSDEQRRSATSEVLEGAVQVNDTGNLGSVPVPDGFGTRVLEGSPPATPRALLEAPRLWGGVRLVVRMPARLNFTVLAGATNYRLLIAKNADFTEVLNESILQSAEIVLSELANGAYFVKVRGIDDLGLEGRDAIADLVVSVSR